MGSRSGDANQLVELRTRIALHWSAMRRAVRSSTRCVSGTAVARGRSTARNRCVSFLFKFSGIVLAVLAATTAGVAEAATTIGTPRCTARSRSTGSRRGSHAQPVDAHGLRPERQERDALTDRREAVQLLRRARVRPSGDGGH